MLIIAGHITVDPEDREDYLRGCADIVEQARKAEGCLDFSLSADLVDPERIDIYERWESDAHLATFRAEGVFEDQASRIHSASVYKYRVSGVEAP
ncbi:antibiotic biosynthesis monooxygenase [Nocardiopsis sp. RSe5-2]|uniref:Antibiotic biosynthesis monooxygenase n=1 Tax=Nocardiopsis endophytica TaxID=3018445 RepID=A0ABT4UD04_9ACTN|nr:antibiotic biosynthesis monooxygenase family protein [Nocardiopsis endophytica]MDA2814874.1 antibiotic biosynthesis monooxygenase [Nocardiopsis endophytica]